MVLVAIAFSMPGGALELSLTAGATRLGPARFEALTVRLNDGASLEVRGIHVPEFGGLGSLTARCNPGRVRCASGNLVWQRADAGPLRFDWRRDPTGLTVTRDAFVLDATWNTDQAIAGTIALDALQLGWLPLPDTGGLSALDGLASGTARAEGERVALELVLDGAAFDTIDGRYAAAGVDATLSLERQPAGEFSLAASWTDGEWLFGPLYLGRPEAPLRLAAAGRLQDSTLRLDRLTLNRDGVVELTLTDLQSSLRPLQLQTATIDLARLNLAGLWAAGFGSLAGAFGADEFDPSGTLAGRAEVLSGRVASASLTLDGGRLGDARDRLSLAGVSGSLRWRGIDEARLEFSWNDGSLFRLPLGASSLELVTGAPGEVVLARPWRVPLLDGALVVDRLRLAGVGQGVPRVELDARLEPIALNALTRTLGWTEFGGRLSGRFADVRLVDRTLEFGGGIDVELFGGQARIERLAVERPFGSLPALAADIEFQRLDLELLTGAFAFGSMRGLLSGHMRDLRLLSWQPVAFDAWFQTLLDSPERVISQRAVESLSSLSGGAGAMASGALLGMFDRFPYRQAGLGCRLAANVCTMRGLHEVEGGGYLILEGRALPRLDIVAHKRRVDWPQLVAQLQAAVAAP